MKVNRSAATRVALLAATSFVSLGIATAAQAEEQSFALMAEDAPAIVVNNNMNPNTAGATGGLDLGVTGVGQMTALVPTPNPITGPGLGVSSCTGTLINPRTVIFAAHCVNTRPAHTYGSATGTGLGVPTGFGLPTSTGVPIAFGFSATNRCTGTATTAGNGCLVNTGPYEVWRDSGYLTHTQLNIYNANQVWYDPRSLTTPGSNGFIAADIAMATLDTAAWGIPTWTMLFSPLTEQTHAFNIGYGQAGTSATVNGTTPCVTPPATGCNGLGVSDHRRRIVENTLSALGSLQDRNVWLFGAANAGLNSNSVYMLDFDSPTGQSAYTGTFEGSFDFDIFNGPALPREGTTAPGDSGGPLVVDEAFSKPVTVAVLSGGSRFHTPGQRFGTYGTHNFYQPLFLYWDVIVGNNPYVYAGAKAGNGNWENPAHWVQLMDPNYAITVDGDLATGLPDTPALGVSPNTVKFGEVCDISETNEDLCTDLANDDTATPVPVGDGNPIYIAGGPGTQNFVPDNVAPFNSADAALHVKARYFDVTLSEGGTTTLSSTRTIDKLTLDGPAAKLNVAAAGTLNVLGETTQWQGWTNVDGQLKSARDMFVGTGILSGVGTIEAPAVTVAVAIVAPGNDTQGTLTVKGDVILSSDSTYLVSVRPEFSDKLIVQANAAAGSPGELLLNDGSVVFSRAAGTSTPRYGGTWVIASAEGGVDGKFGSAYAGEGVLKVKLSYTANDVIASISASSFNTLLVNPSATSLAFANAFDALRLTSYNKLLGIYDNLDWMNGQQLASTFEALSPANMVGEVRAIHDRQNARFLGHVGDRLSLMGTGRAEGISFVGGASALAQSRDGMSASAQLGLTDSNSVKIAAPNGLSGFVSMGGDTIGSTYGGGEQSGQHSRYFASGIEAPFGDAMIGTAIGYAETRSMAGQDEAKSKVSQAAAYASLPVGKSAYVGGVVAAERASSDSNRLTTDTTSMFRLSGATHSARYMANLEAGVRTGIGSGLYLNPRAQLGVSHYALGGFRETGGETALALDTLKVNRIESRFGARLDGTATLGSWSVRPNLQADYVRLLAGADAGLKVAFAAAPDHSFALPLAAGGSGWMEVKGGVELTRGKFSLGLSGQATAGDAPIADQRGAVDLSFRF